MALPSLLADENVPPLLVRLLRDHGFDVEAIADVAAGSSDLDVLGRAHAQQRWLISFDRDCGELVFARAAPVPPAIVYLRQGPQSLVAYAQTVLSLLQSEAAALLGHLAVVDGGRVRRRPLPGTAAP